MLTHLKNVSLQQSQVSLNALNTQIKQAKVDKHLQWPHVDLSFKFQVCFIYIAHLKTASMADQCAEQTKT